MNLTDLATFKRYINLNTVNSDGVFNTLIPSESQSFLDETGRSSFDSQTYNEVRDGQGTDIMQLAYFPVTGITSLQIDSNLVPLSTAWNMRGYQWDALGKISLIGMRFCCGRRNVLVSYPAGYPAITIAAELQTIPVTPGPYIVQVAAPNWRTNTSVVFFVGGGTLTSVLTAPAAGQYFVMGGGGYLFNASDQGKQVQISYTAAGYPSDIVGAVNEMVLLRYKQRDSIEIKSIRLGDTTTSYTGANYPDHVKRIIAKYKRYFFVPGFSLMSIRFTVLNATEVEAQISSTTERIRERMIAAINSVNTQLQRYIVSGKLSGQVLKSHTGNLKRSIHQIPATIEGDTLRGGVGLGSEARYGLIHEFGGTIHIPEIRPVNALALHWLGKDGASVFAMHVKAHDVVMPERSFMRSSFAEFTDRIEAAIEKAATG